MIGLGRVKTAARLDPGDDLCREHAHLAELRDVSLGDAGLLRRLRKDRRAVLTSDIGSLSIELRRVVRHREIDLQDAAVAYPLRVEGNPHRLGMTGPAATHHFVVRGSLGAAGIPRDRARDAGDVLKYALDAPEAAAGKDGDLAASCRRRLVGGGGRNDPSDLRGRADLEQPRSQRKEGEDETKACPQAGGGSRHRQTPLVWATMTVASNSRAGRAAKNEKAPLSR